MRKSAFFLAIVIAAATPSLATAKAKAKRAKGGAAATMSADPYCDAGCRLFRNGIAQIFIPLEQIFGGGPGPVIARY